MSRNRWILIIILFLLSSSNTISNYTPEDFFGTFVELIGGFVGSYAVVLILGTILDKFKPKKTESI